MGRDHGRKANGVYSNRESEQNSIFNPISLYGSSTMYGCITVVDSCGCCNIDNWTIHGASVVSQRDTRDTFFEEPRFHVALM